jgi:oxygen-dependent protoporphyrinogen oxidase
MVTAASFGSQKWARWRPPEGGEILRISLGRDGLPVLHLSDDEILQITLAEVGRHLEIDIAPLETRITRWPGAFAQYRPHHADWVDAVERSLPAGLFVGGASYRGIGVPACVRQGRNIADRASKYVAAL